MASLRDEILERAAAGGEGGVTMGAIVDALLRDGRSAERVEAEIWALLGARLLTPCGYVRRLVRRKSGELHTNARRYEFLLVPWSADKDRRE
jgi:hypothetical protein